MRWLFYIYLVITVVITVAMMLRGQVGYGLALLGASALGFVGGSGIQGSRYAGTGKAGLALGVVIFAVGLVIAYTSGVRLRLFGIDLPGVAWVIIGFVVSYLAARPEDVAAPIKS